jgi:DNA-binding CsgD family transcriptional regulator
MSAGIATGAHLLTWDRVTADALVQACRRRGHDLSVVECLPGPSVDVATLVLDLDALPVGWAGESSGGPDRAPAGCTVTFGGSADARLPFRVDRRLGPDAGLDVLCAVIGKQGLTARSVAATDALSRPPHEVLTPRERELCRGLLAGHGTGRLARDLGISEGTVRTHLQNIFAKLQLTSRAQVVAWAAASDRFSDEPTP